MVVPGEVPLSHCSGKLEVGYTLQTKALFQGSAFETDAVHRAIHLRLIKLVMVIARNDDSQNRVNIPP